MDIAAVSYTLINESEDSPMKTEIKTVIFSRAHAMTRAIRAEYPAADYRATFAAALRIAYAEISENPRAQWETMTGEEKQDALRATVCFCMNRDRAETDKRGNFRPNYFKWIACDDDICATVNEAYTRMNKAFENAEKALADGRRDSLPTLRAIMANAARSAARFIAQAEMRHASALRIESMTDESGNAVMREYIKDSDSTAEPIAPNPETALIIRDSIERACKDDTDRDIIAGLAAQYSAREIAERIGMTHTAVNKRIKRIRERYRDSDSTSAGYGMAYAPAN